MMEVRIQQIKIGPKPQVDMGMIMSKLSQILDKGDFWGKIEMKFEAGKLVHITMNQGFTVDDFINSINL